MHHQADEPHREAAYDSSVGPPRGCLYRFGEPSGVAVLECETTLPGSLTLVAEGVTAGGFLRLRWRGGGDCTSHGDGERDRGGESLESIVIALPVVAIDGRPMKLLLEVLGDASGCEIAVDASDARGSRCRYSFGAVDFTGWRTCPAECRDARRLDGGTDVESPIQFFQLRVTPPVQCNAVALGLGSLSVTGDVRLLPPGLADGLVRPRGHNNLL